MNKIVRGKIRSIDGFIDKKKGKSYEATIDTLEYIIALDDGYKYKTSCSIGDFKVGEQVDIVMLEKAKDRIKEGYENKCIILNKVSAKKILSERLENFENLLLLLMASVSIGVIGFDVIFRYNHSFISIGGLFLLSIMFIGIIQMTIEGIKNKKPLFSEDEYALIKKYKNGYNINKISNMQININKKAKVL